jgi:hypothetical protein
MHESLESWAPQAGDEPLGIVAVNRGRTPRPLSAGRKANGFIGGNQEPRDRVSSPPPAVINRCFGERVTDRHPIRIFTSCCFSDPGGIGPRLKAVPPALKRWLAGQAMQPRLSASDGGPRANHRCFPSLVSPGMGKVRGVLAQSGNHLRRIKLPGPRRPTVP